MFTREREREKITIVLSRLAGNQTKCTNEIALIEFLLITLKFVLIIEQLGYPFGTQAINRVIAGQHADCVSMESTHKNRHQKLTNRE